MASPAVEKMLLAVQHLSDSELQELTELLEDEMQTRVAQNHASDPFLALIGRWQEMGDATIDIFDRLIDDSRAMPGRGVTLGD